MRVGAAGDQCGFSRCSGSWLFALRWDSDLYAAAGCGAGAGGRTTAAVGAGRPHCSSPTGRWRPRISLDSRPILIGRADDSTLVLDDDYASTRHARIAQQGDDWYVEDLGSTNGTYLDRAKVTGPTRVPLGVPVRIGKTVIELRS